MTSVHMYMQYPMNTCLCMSHLLHARGFFCFFWNICACVVPGRCVTQHLALSIPSTTTFWTCLWRAPCSNARFIKRLTDRNTCRRTSWLYISLVCAKLSNSKSNYVRTTFYITSIKLYMFTLSLYYICPLVSLSWILLCSPSVYLPDK